jgi:hypothetical protein
MEKDDNSNVINPRTMVLETSVQLESNISSILGYLLSIDIEISKSLSCKSTALSFNAKLNLLLDMNILNKTEMEKFVIFSQIRNQFAHNVRVVSFESCIDEIDGLLNRLRKLYNIVEIDTELNAQSYFIRILQDIILISSKIIEEIKYK